MDRIQAILESTTVKLYPTDSLLLKGEFCGNDTYTTYPNNYFGYGRVNVNKAVQTCREYCKMKGGSDSIGKFNLPLLLENNNFSYSYKSSSR